MKRIKETKYYTIYELSIMLGISERSVSNKLSELNLKKYKTTGKQGIALYTQYEYDLLGGKKRLTDLSYIHSVSERQKIPIVITYYIYESKMNSENCF
jgi:hypothetical protein